MKPSLPAKLSEDSTPVTASCWTLCNTTGDWEAGLCPKIESNCSKYLYILWFCPDLLLCAFIFL